MPAQTVMKKEGVDEVEAEEETTLSITNYKVFWKTKPLHSLLKDSKKILDRVASVDVRSNFLVVRLPDADV